MKILQIGRYPNFEILDVPIPTPGPGEALVKILAITTCPQWDLHLRHDEPMFLGHKFHYPYTPGQPGHEATGIVEALGDGVTELAVGDRVSVWRDAGHHRDGCYAEYTSRAVADLIRVPADLPVEATAPVELAMCVAATILMLKEMNAISGRRVGIVGLGPAGMIAAQMARAEGAVSVVGFDVTERRRNFAETYCVDESFDPHGEIAVRFPERPAASGLDLVIDCVGAKRSVEFAMDRARETVALFGVQREEYTFAPRHYGGLKLCGYPGHSRQAAEYAVGLIETGKLNLAPLTTYHLPLERYNDGVDLLERQEAIKICFHP